MALCNPLAARKIMSSARFNSPLLKRFATVLAALHLLLVAQVPLAQAAMIGTPEVVAEHQQQVDRQQLLTMLDDQDVQKKLEAMGVERDQVENRINGIPAAKLAPFNQTIDQAPANSERSRVGTGLVSKCSFR